MHPGRSGTSLPLDDGDHHGRYEFPRRGGDIDAEIENNRGPTRAIRHVP